MQSRVCFWAGEGPRQGVSKKWWVPRHSGRGAQGHPNQQTSTSRENIPSLLEVRSGTLVLKRQKNAELNINTFSKIWFLQSVFWQLIPTCVGPIQVQLLFLLSPPCKFHMSVLQPCKKPCQEHTPTITSLTLWAQCLIQMEWNNILKNYFCVLILPPTQPSQLFQLYALWFSSLALEDLSPSSEN